MADHLALGGVRVGVAAEQGGDDQHGRGPQGEHPHHLLDGHPGAAGVQAGHAPPHPHEQEQAAVDGGQGEVDAPRAGPGACRARRRTRRPGISSLNGELGSEAPTAMARWPRSRAGPGGGPGPGCRRAPRRLRARRRRRPSPPAVAPGPGPGEGPREASPTRSPTVGRSPGVGSTGRAVVVRSTSIGSRVSWVVGRSCRRARGPPPPSAELAHVPRQSGRSPRPILNAIIP